MDWDAHRVALAAKQSREGLSGRRHPVWAAPAFVRDNPASHFESSVRTTLDKGLVADPNCTGGPPVRRRVEGKQQL
jgi:hypothetical protein